MRPKELLYSETHEWVKVNGGVATVGITDHAVEHLSDLVYIELPRKGDRVTRGQPFGTIESVKAVSDLNAPVTGTIVEVNDGLADQLDILAGDPFGSGWLLKIELGDASELEALVSPTSYEEILARES